MSCDPVWNRREDDQLIEPASANRRAAGDSGVVIFGYDDPEGRLRGRLCTEGILRFWNLGSHIARTDLDSSSPKVSCRNRPRWTDDPGVGFHPMNSRTSSSVPPPALPPSPLPSPTSPRPPPPLSRPQLCEIPLPRQLRWQTDVTRDVSLKANLKKTVEGNEENAWSEMPVLQDLAGHHNVVRSYFPRTAALPSPFSLPHAS